MISPFFTLIFYSQYSGFFLGTSGDKILINRFKMASQAGLQHVPTFFTKWGQFLANQEGALRRFRSVSLCLFVLFRKIKPLYCGLIKGLQWKVKRNCMEAVGKAASIQKDIELEYERTENDRQSRKKRV